MRKPIGFRRHLSKGRPANAWAPCELLAAMGRLSPSLSPPPAGCIGLLLPHFRDSGPHLLRSVEKSARANLSKAFQDAALEAVLRALFSIPESGDSETLSHMARAYIDGARIYRRTGTADPARRVFEK